MMTSSKTESFSLCSLLFETTPNYETNLQTLLSLIEKCNENTLIVAPEVCLTAYDYDNFEAVLTFAPYAIEAIKKASRNKIIILTILERRNNSVFNFAKIFYNGEVVFERAKAKLFRFGDEHKYMQEGSVEDFKIVEVGGIKIAVFICFELRFKELWLKSEGADVIAVPAWWGVVRREHFKIFTEALALMNQCYVVASDSKNKECSAQSGIINPQGEAIRNGEKQALILPLSKKAIAVMRRYMDIGLSL